jgi:hypothetical protein
LYNTEQLMIIFTVTDSSVWTEIKTFWNKVAAVFDLSSVILKIMQLTNNSVSMNLMYLLFVKKSIDFDFLQSMLKGSTIRLLLSRMSAFLGDKARENFKPLYSTPELLIHVEGILGFRLYELIIKKLWNFI